MVQQNFKDLFPNFGGLDINQLLQQQAEFTQGMAGNVPTGPSAYQSVASGPIALDPNFSATLAQMLQTGAPVDVSGAVGAQRSSTERMMRDMTEAYNARMGAMGKVGSTAHTAKQARGTGDLLSQMFERISGLQVGAAESAAGRRMGAMDTALGQGRLDLGARQADLARAGGIDKAGIERGRLGLTEKTGQAGAGMDMLKLLSSFAGQGGGGGGRVASAPQRQGTVSRTPQRAPRASYGGGRAPVRDLGAASMGNAALLEKLGGAHRLNAFAGTGGLPRNWGGRSDTMRALANPSIMSQYGAMTGQNDLATQMNNLIRGQASSLGALGSSSAANTSAMMPLLLQMMQGQQASALGKQFGPRYAFGG